MLYKIFFNILFRVKKINWLARFYRKYFTNLPMEDSRETFICRKQDKKLAELSISPEEDILFYLYIEIDKDNIDGATSTINSLLKQMYSNWKLTIIGDHEGEGLKFLSEQDARIGLSCTVSKNISKNEYVGQIYSGDKLHSQALKAFAGYIDSDTNIAYSDHDYLSESAERVQPQFKPDWNDDLAYSNDYLQNLTFFRASFFVESSNNLTESWLRFMSNYQRMLHVLDCCQGKGIKHVPFTLYHQRLGSDGNYFSGTDLNALNLHLRDKNADAVSGLVVNSFKVNWPLPEKRQLVSIIIPTKNAKELVKQCIESVCQKTEYQNYEILLVDNQSDDKGSLDYFQELNAQKVVRLLNYDKPFNYSAINNFAVNQARGSILVLMNNDISVISPEWLTEMVRQVSRDEIGCVGAKLYYPNDTIQHAGVILGLGRCAGHSHKHYHRTDNGYMNRLKLVQNYSAVTAACLGIRKEVYQQVGGLNEKDLTVAFNDVDLCLKVNAVGYRNLWSPYIELYHHESVSRGEDDTPEKKSRYLSEVAYMQNTWGLETIIDSAYSPWLTIAAEDFAVERQDIVHAFR